MNNKFQQSLLFLILCLCGITSGAQTQDSIYLFSYFKGNGKDGLHLAYSKNGKEWKALNNDKSFLKPTIGNDKLMRDPCIIQGGDGIFHMVWTVSWNDRGIGYASSEDLIHWTPEKFIPVMEDEKKARNCWAPEITYDPASKIYMIYWATTITDRFPESQSDLEKGYNHRIYYTTTKDFKDFSSTKLLFEPGFNVIDATIKKNGDRFVMFYKNETRKPEEKNLNLAFSKSLTGPYKDLSGPITGDYWAEGPTALKIDGKWWVYFDKYIEKKYGAVSSTDLQHWQDASEEISFPEGIRHGTAFKVSHDVFRNLQDSLLSFRREK